MDHHYLLVHNEGGGVVDIDKDIVAGKRDEPLDDRTDRTKRLKTEQHNYVGSNSLYSAMRISSLVKHNNKGVSITPLKACDLEQRTNVKTYSITPQDQSLSCKLSCNGNGTRHYSESRSIVEPQMNGAQAFRSSAEAPIKTLRQQWWKNCSVSKKTTQVYEECENWKWCPEKISTQRPVYCRICAEGISERALISECAFCEKPCCISASHDCSDDCVLCRKTFCSFCFTRNYDEAIVRSLCLDCNRSDDTRKLNENDMDIG